MENKNIKNNEWKISINAIFDDIFQMLYEMSMELFFLFNHIDLKEFNIK